MEYIGFFLLVSVAFNMDEVENVGQGILFSVVAIIGAALIILGLK